MKKDLLIIGVGTINRSEISIKRSDYEQLFIQANKVVDLSTILQSDIKEERITIFKNGSCGMTEHIFSNGIIDSNERMIDDIKGKFICDYVWKSLKMYFFLETK